MFVTYHCSKEYFQMIWKLFGTCEFNNHLPVSSSYLLSKVYKKIIYNRLISFLANFDILFENQFGLTNFHSLYMAAMVFTDTLIKSLENGDFVIGVYLDFPKAFDTVDQEILKNLPLWR